MSEIAHTLRNCKGVLHLGGHLAEESNEYAAYGKPVIWVEAIETLHSELQKNIARFSNQISYRALLSEVDNQEMTFYISNNGQGSSSSLFEFDLYGNGAKSLWPDQNLKMVDSIKMKTKTLDTLFAENSLDINNFDFWVLDLQGAELLALKGASKSIDKCSAILTEISTEPVYKGGVLWTELSMWLKDRGFRPVRNPQAIHENILFVR
jgi:FkbM family methyltransferase